jgi:hypothetical protein
MDRVRRRNYQLELRCPGERAVVVGVLGNPWRIVSA